MIMMRLLLDLESAMHYLSARNVSKMDSVIDLITDSPSLSSRLSRSDGDAVHRLEGLARLLSRVQRHTFSGISLYQHR